jgi:hypothetical protein
MTVFWILFVLFLVGLGTSAWSLMRAASRQVPTPADRFREFVPTREPVCWNCREAPAAVAGLCDECTWKLHKMLKEMSA